MEYNHHHKVYLENAPALICFARKFVFLYAEDLVHDVFLKTWGSAIFDLPEKDLRKVLFASVRNACIDHLRRVSLETKTSNERKRQLQMEELTYAENMEDLYMQKDIVAIVKKKIEELPEKSREIFLKTYIEGLKASEVAEQLNISVRTVENQLYRALLFLRQKCSRLLIFLF